jgi:hypothetical protein
MAMTHIYLKRSKIRRIFGAHKNEVFVAVKIKDFYTLKEIFNFLNHKIVDFAGPENPEDFRYTKHFVFTCLLH